MRGISEMGAPKKSEEPRDLEDTRDILRFMTAGSVDDGKSTLIGRLLWDSKAILDDQLEQLRDASRRRGDEHTNLALVTDGLRAEREQGITIDVAFRYFSTPKRSFIVADVPGHVQYTRNMVTAASTSSLAVILIDARRGFVEQSLRHAFIASLLRIPHLVVAVNKLDLVGYSRDVFEGIRTNMSRWLGKLGVDEVQFIPINALGGDNIVHESEHMPWYSGPPLLRHLESVQIASDRNLEDARFPVQYVIRPEREHSEGYRTYAGTVAGGVLAPGDEVTILPSMRSTTISRIEVGGEPLAEAFPPMSVTLALKDQLDCSRGDLLCRSGHLPTVGSDLTAMLVWMSERPLRSGNSYQLKHTTQSVKARVTDLDFRIDVRTLAANGGVDSLGPNDIGRVRIGTTKPIFYDPYDRNRVTGSFILIDETTGETVAAGMLLEPSPSESHPIVPDSASTLRNDWTGRGVIVIRTDDDVQTGPVIRSLLLGFAGTGRSSILVETVRGLVESASSDGEAGRRGMNYRSSITRHELTVVDASDGWRAPLQNGSTISELAKDLELGVIVAVGVRPGCISHAILTQEAIESDGVPFLGWVASIPIGAGSGAPALIEGLEKRLTAPLLGVMSEKRRYSCDAMEQSIDVAGLVAGFRLRSGA